jgi:hypothetical protein
MSGNGNRQGMFMARQPGSLRAGEAVALTSSLFLFGLMPLINSIAPGLSPSNRLSACSFAAGVGGGGVRRLLGRL